MSNGQLANVEDDYFLFGDEEEEIAPKRVKHGANGNKWRLLIVDDDEAIHTSTRFVLSDYEFEGAPVELLHAYTATQARKFLKDESNIAVMILDVVMETDDAGLQLVDYVRNELEDTDIRIILRTGQPGMAPEWEVISKYDINDYKTKTELTQERLFTTVTAALRSYEQLKLINASRTALERIVEGAPELFALRDMEDFTAFVLKQICYILERPEQGFVCVADPGAEATRPVMLCALGDYEKGVGRELDQGCDDVSAKSVLEAFETRSHKFEDDRASIYIQTPRDHRMVVHLSLDQPVSSTGRQLIEVFCVNAAISLDNSDLFEDVRGLAYFDRLTGLGNRSYFVRELDAMLEDMPKDGSEELAVVFIDIDHFDDINDLVGQAQGDVILKSFAARLLNDNPDSKLTARVSGDEFGLIFKTKGNGASGFNAQWLLTCFEPPFNVQDYEIQAKASVGIRYVTGADVAGSDLLRDAWVALRRAKEGGRGTYCVYDPHMDQEVTNRASMLSELRSAIAENQLTLNYQPQFSYPNQELVGAEALIRWIKPDGTQVPPSVFIPVAERSGLLIPIGELVLRTACQAAKDSQDAGYPPFAIAVNVSVEQIYNSDLPTLVAEVLEETGLEARWLKLELTESMVMGDVDNANQVLGKLKDLGVGLAIDDFGTGYSSLAYLKRLQVDELKIDRSFISDVSHNSGDAVITEAIIGLGHSFGLKVLAEGVETTEQEEFLKMLGCDEAQGYLYSKPLNLEDFRDFMKARAGDD